MKRQVNIDDLVAENELTLTIGGKDYIVRDIQMDAFLKATQVDPENVNQEMVYDQLALFFDIDKEELKHIGLRAASLALREINKWIQKETEDMRAGLDEDQPKVDP